MNNQNHLEVSVNLFRSEVKEAVSTGNMVLLIECIDYLSWQIRMKTSEVIEAISEIAEISLGEAEMLVMKVA